MQIGAASAELTQSLGRSPTPRELADNHRLHGRGDRRGHRVEQRLLDALAGRQRRRRGRRRRSMLDAIGVDDENLEHVEIRESLKPLLDRLEPREKKILLLRFFKNMTQSQIADEIGVSQMHVSRLLTRTLAQLRALAGGGAAGARQRGRRPARRCWPGGAGPTTTIEGHDGEHDRDQRGLPAPEAPRDAQLDQLGQHDRAARPGATAVHRPGEQQQRGAVHGKNPPWSRPSSPAGTTRLASSSAEGQQEQHEALDGDQRGRDDRGGRDGRCGGCSRRQPRGSGSPNRGRCDACDQTRSLQGLFNGPSCDASRRARERVHIVCPMARRRSVAAPDLTDVVEERGIPQPWIGATVPRASTRTRSCSSRSATPVRPSSRSRRPSRCADAARCASSASRGRSRLARTTGSGAV